MSDSMVASRAERLAAHNAAIEAANKDPKLSPATGTVVTKANLARFAVGLLVFGVVWGAGLGVVSQVLLPEHYKQIPGIRPETLLGIANAATAVASLVANLIFGTFSDRSRSRFGRRTPFIVGGAVLGGITLFLVGTTYNPVLLVIYYCLCMFGLNCMIAPMTASISDRIPSGSRGTVSAFYGAGSTVGTPVGTLIGAAFVTNLLPGFAVGGVLMFLAGILAVIIIPREESADYLPAPEGGCSNMFLAFRPPRLKGAHDYYKAFIGRLLMLVSYQMITAYQMYIVEHYIHQSVKQAAATISVISVITMIVSLVGSLVAGPFSDLIGRRKVPVVVASVCFAIGVAMPWIMPTTTGMYLYAAIAGLGYGIYSSVDQALLIDVLPSKEEAGKDLGILNLATTLGQMVGPLLTSTIVVHFGYVWAFPTSIVMAILGCVFIMTIRHVK